MIRGCEFRNSQIVRKETVHENRMTQNLNIKYFITGGAVSSGLGIYDTMQYIQPPVATWCVGQCCSMGSLLLASGANGMRYSLPNSKIMIHQPSGGFRVSFVLQF